MENLQNSEHMICIPCSSNNTDKPVSETFYESLEHRMLDEDDDFVPEYREIPRCDDLKNLKIEDIDGFSLNFDNEEVTSFIRRIYEPNTDLIRKYGPKNPYIPVDGFKQKCPYSIDGECRMMTCNCEENITEFHIDWFTGKCINCDTWIENKNEAIRIPFLSGSFKHCFCGVDCAHDFYGFDDTLIEHALVEIIRILSRAYPCEYVETKVRRIERDENIDIVSKINTDKREIYIQNIFAKFNIPNTNIDDYSDSSDSECSADVDFFIDYSNGQSENKQEETKEDDLADDDDEEFLQFMEMLNSRTREEQSDEEV